MVGAAIGNGVMDYFFQEPSYAEYAYSHGLIPLAAKKRFDADWDICVATILSSNKPLTVGSFSKCDMIDRVKIAAGQPNEYNTATFNGYTTITSPVSDCFMCVFIVCLLLLRSCHLRKSKFIVVDIELLFSFVCILIFPNDF